jgi:hypothetical protein
VGYSPNVVVAVDVLSRMARSAGYGEWDGKRAAVAAALLMAESQHDRRADEFLELVDLAEKRKEEIPLLKMKMAEYEAIPDEALDMHTSKGRAMGRGQRYWYEVSSETVNKTPAYKRWRVWWRPLMMKTVGNKE